MRNSLILDQIRKLVPELIAKEIVSAQPMPQSTRKAFAELIELLKDGDKPKR